jgi:hypothetical protein
VRGGGETNEHGCDFAGVCGWHHDRDLVR